MPSWPEGPSVGFTLSQLGFATSRRFAALVAPLGLEPRHFAVLRELGQADGQPQNVVAERLAIPASTMVALTDHLEAERMIERRAHPTDRRTRLLHLTNHGAQVLAAAAKVGAQWEQQICAGLSAAERRQLLALLNRVAVSIGVTETELPDHGTGARPQPPGFSDVAEQPPDRRARRGRR